MFLGILTGYYYYLLTPYESKESRPPERLTTYYSLPPLVCCERIRDSLLPTPYFGRMLSRHCAVSGRRPSLLPPPYSRARGAGSPAAYYLLLTTFMRLVAALPTASYLPAGRYYGATVSRSAPPLVQRPVSRLVGRRIDANSPTIAALCRRPSSSLPGTAATMPC